MSKNSSRFKMALIPILSIVFLYILWDRIAPTAEANAAAREGSNTNTSVRKPDAERKRDFSRPKKFSTYNPFLPLNWEPSSAELTEQSPTEGQQDEASVAEGTKEVASDPTAGIGEVEAIFRDGSGVSALVGDRILRIGDMIGEDYCVDSISEDGIKLKRLKD